MQEGVTSAIQLLDWQRAYVEDPARRTFLAKSVQVGGSFAVSLRRVLRVLERPRLQIMLSASERQSLELMEKVKQHTAGAGVVVKSGYFESTSIKQHTATFPNRGRIIALPANPDTARGYSGDVVLDEFAIHRDPKAIWKALVGRTLRGYDLDVLSSFKGKQNKFYELAKECGLHLGVAPVPNPVQAGVWSGHWADIHLAVAQGLKVDVDELRNTVGDDEIFMEEFECIPIDGAMDFIDFDLVRGCEVETASIEFDHEPRAEQYFGFDVARKRDLSEVWVLSREPDGLLTRGLITMRRKKFSEQREIVRAVAACCDRGCVDETGIGAQIAEELRDEFPGVVEGVTFTGPVKARMPTEVKSCMEERGVGLPESREIRRSIQSVKRFVTPSGNIRFDANRTSSGHADEFWALALAMEAARGQSGYVPASDGGTVGRSVLGNLMEATF